MTLNTRAQTEIELIEVPLNATPNDIEIQKRWDLEKLINSMILNNLDLSTVKKTESPMMTPFSCCPDKKMLRILPLD
jgi:hypothetical protein